MRKRFQRIWAYFGGEQGQRALVALAFGAYLLAGLLLFDDFGASTDEMYQTDKARLTLDYVLGKSDELLRYDDRHYGAIFSILLEGVSAPFDDPGQQLLARHWLTFMAFFAAVAGFYRLQRQLGYGRGLALFGCAALALHPQLFGHSFYNPKDIPFLAMFVLALLSLQGMRRWLGWRTAALHGLASGLLVVFRLPGVLMWAATAALLLWLVLAKKASLAKAAGLAVVYGAVALATMLVFLPALWNNPVGELLVFFSMQPFEWTSQELLAGTFYPLDQVPWYHLPVYIGVTTPLPLLAGALAGWLGLAWLAARGKLGWRGMFTLLPLSVSAAVLLGLQPNIYNGWRHVFFLWPQMVLALVWLANLLWRRAAAFRSLASRGAIGIIAVALVAWLVVVNAALHPYEYVYYNLLAGRPNNAPRQNYIMDYWGLTYREAFEWIAATDDRPVIYVSVENVIPAAQNLGMLPAKDRERIRLQEIHTGIPDDYYITNFKETLALKRPNARLLHSISRANTVLAAIYRPR